MQVFTKIVGFKSFHAWVDTTMSQKGGHLCEAGGDGNKDCFGL